MFSIATIFCVSTHAWASDKVENTLELGHMSYVSATTGLDCSTADKLSIKAALPIEGVPESERWRLGLLDSLLSERDVWKRKARM